MVQKSQDNQAILESEARPGEKEVAHAPWQREFFKNIDSFEGYGLSEEQARELLTTFLKLSGSTPMPAVMDSFRSPERLEEVGVYTRRMPHLQDFMVSFLRPLLSQFAVEGKENLKYIMPLIGRFPIVMIANHLSHLDAPAIYHILFTQGGAARKLADSLVFIAGRLAFEPDFTRLGLYMIDTLLVCLKKDMSDNPSLADLMTRINMRSFRQAQQLQKEGKIIAIFPEGTRSRTGRLINFVDTVYHYAANKIVVPVSLEGTENILPASSFLFKRSPGKLIIGKPVLLGSLPKKLMADLPDSVMHVSVPKETNKKRFVIDNLAVLVGSNLHRHRHGAYRNLYLSEISDPAQANVLIQKPDEPVERVVVLGHTQRGTAVSSILANKKVDIKIYTPDAQAVADCNEAQQDGRHYPLFKLPPNMTFTSDPADIERATLLIQAVAAVELDKFYEPVAGRLRASNAPVVNIVKGFTQEPGLISDFFIRRLGLEPERMVALAGANYPDQIMERKLTGFELAAQNPELVNHLTMLFSKGYVFTRPAMNPSDVRGVMLGGALKNIYALGIGLLDGYYEKNLGGNSDNALFHISNRVIKEMTGMGVELGGEESTFQGLSGMTDLMLSCFGQNSPDRQLGHDFVYGRDISQEESPGYTSLQMLPRLVDLTVENYPVAASIYAVIIQGADVNKTLDGVAYMLRRY